MTFKKGYFKEKEGFYFQVSYGLSRWVLCICKVGEEHNNEKYLIEQNFKLKRQAKEKFDFYLNHIELLKKDNKPNYEKGFNVLMEYWDSINDEEKPKVDKRLKKLGL